METLSNIANIVKNIAQVTTALTTISTGLGLIEKENNTIVTSDVSEILSSDNPNKVTPNININFIVNDESNLPKLLSVNNTGIDSKFDI